MTLIYCQNHNGVSKSTLNNRLGQDVAKLLLRADFCGDSELLYPSAHTSCLSIKGSRQVFLTDVKPFNSPSGPLLVKHKYAAQLRFMWRLSRRSVFSQDHRNFLTDPGLSVVCPCKSIIGRKHNTQFGVLFRFVSSSVDGNMDEYDKPLLQSEKIWKILRPITVLLRSNQNSLVYSTSLCLHVSFCN